MTVEHSFAFQNSRKDKVQSQTFSQISDEVAADFLQTVVLLDDQAFFAPIEPESVTILEEPPLKASVSTASVSETSKQPKISMQPVTNGPKHEEPSADPASAPDAVDDTHDLHAKAIIDAFGKKGLVCSVFRPEKEERSADDFFPALLKADLVVLDWIIHKDDGETALAVIGKLCQAAGEADRRGLRLIAIYTGQKDLLAVAARVHESITELGVSATLIECTVRVSAITIGVFAKPGVNVPTNLESRVVRFDDLPSRLIHEFAKVTCGLIPNLLISGLSALRQSTHVLLAQLNKDLDAAFLSHKCLLDQPDDAKHLALQLVSDEFRAVMDEYNVLKTLNEDIIAAWLSEYHADGFSISLPDKDKKGLSNKVYSIDREKVAQLLGDGFTTAKGTLGLPNSAKGELTKLFLRSEEQAEECDNRFAMLTSCRSRYKMESPVPSLTMGTILATGTEGTREYLLCIYPVCNSARVDNNQPIPFLPLSVDQKVVYFVARHKEKFLQLRLQEPPFTCVTKVFSPSAPEKVVRAELKDGDFVFKDSANVEFTWIAELKPAQAQRVMNSFAEWINRIGLDESEWLRQKRKA